jgi:phosphomevalonate kinase
VRVIAPGKLVLTGAYAVLEGAPAIVAAVDRYAVSHDTAPDEVDVQALHDEGGRKLGLGSSAASMVASEAARGVARGEDPTLSITRTHLFRRVRAAHAAHQGGGSGVDVAAAVHGGVLRYSTDGDEVSIRPVEWPAGVVLISFFSGSSARTSDLRARVGALRSRAVLEGLHVASREAAAFVEQGDGRGFIRAAREFGRALAALGRAADAPIVPPAFAELADLAEAEEGAFLPSGAGGGDVAVWLGETPPSSSFLLRATALSMRRLTLGFDRGGVRTEPMST